MAQKIAALGTRTASPATPYSPRSKQYQCPPRSLRSTSC
jgi:hypothetical protein